jgi:hypothetical protein
MMQLNDLHKQKRSTFATLLVAALFPAFLPAAEPVIDVPASGGRYEVAPGQALDLRFADALSGLRHVGLRVQIVEEQPLAILRVSAAVDEHGTLYFTGEHSRTTVEVVAVASAAPAKVTPRMPAVRRPTARPTRHAAPARMPTREALPARVAPATPEVGSAAIVPAATVATPEPMRAPTPIATPAQPEPSPERVLKIGREEGLPGQRRLRLEETAESAEWLVLRFRVVDGKDARIARVSWEAGEIARVETAARGKDLWITVRVARALATKRTKVTVELEREGKYVFPLTAPTLVNSLGTLF